MSHWKNQIDDTYAYTTAPVPTNPTGSVSYSYSDNSWGDLLVGVTTTIQ